jgi:hypothetical protein
MQTLLLLGLMPASQLAANFYREWWLDLKPTEVEEPEEAMSGG